MRRQERRRCTGLTLDGRQRSLWEMVGPLAMLLAMDAPESVASRGVP